MRRARTFCRQRMKPVTNNTGSASPDSSTRMRPGRPKAVPECSGHCQATKVLPPVCAPGSVVQRIAPVYWSTTTQRRSAKALSPGTSLLQMV